MEGLCRSLFLIKEKWVTLEQIIILAKQRFWGEFSKKLFLEQLVYTADLGNLKAEFLRNPVDETKISNFFEEQVKNTLILVFSFTPWWPGRGRVSCSISL